MAISALLSIHIRLEAHFAWHQELLLDRRLPEAKRALVAYAELLELHMRHEEERLLPIYTRVEPSARFPLALFTGQHQRLRELLQASLLRLSALENQHPPAAQAVIELLDHERTYKHLNEHHDGAERQALFPALDRLASAEEQARLLSDCTSEWNALEARWVQAGALVGAARS
jgi:hemerythrin-like domain-containing protein